MSPWALEVEGLVRSFGPVVVLNGVDLTVPPGTLSAILGPSGSGKTTLLRLVAGFDRADAGTIRIQGNLVSQGRHIRVPPEHRHIGVVPQEGSLFPHLRVAANVGFGLARSARRATRVGQLLELVGLAGFERRFPHELSGGQQQRVALARALAVDPSLVLLDEPFSALDAGLRALVRSEVAGVLRRSGATAVLVTHDQDEALSWADHVAVLRQGRIVQAGTPEDLYRRPADAQLARFLGAANLVPGQAHQGVAQTALGPLALEGDCHLEGPATVLVRPEQLDVSRRPHQGTPSTPTPGSPQALRGVVALCEYFGHDAIVEVDAGPAGRLTVRVAGGPRWQPGEPVGLAVRGPVRAWPAGGTGTGTGTGPGTGTGTGTGPGMTRV